MRIRRWVSVFTTSLLAFGTVFALTAAPAGAATVEYLCGAYSPETGAELTSEKVALAIEGISGTAPAVAEQGTEFTVEIAGRSMPVPASVAVGGTDIEVTWAQDLMFRVDVNGADIVPDSVTTVGGDFSATASIDEDENFVQIEIPTQVPGGAVFDVPGFTFRVLAGNLASIKTTTRTGITEGDMRLTVAVIGGTIQADTRCTSDFVTITSTRVPGGVAATTTTAASTTVPPVVTTLQVPTTTAAPSLPRTGSTSGPLGLAGFAALVAGLTVLGATRRRLQTTADE